MDDFIRVLFDTNIYGFITKEDDPEKLVLKITESKIMVCGSRVVRRELRKIPFGKNNKSRKLRSKVLKYYALFVDDKRDYEVNKFILELAKEYKKTYAGNMRGEDLFDDFLIVATASIHVIKIVCSNDEKTMKEPEAIKAYKKVNGQFQLPEPEFISLEELKELIR
ncbi:MAG: PIN domain-containing protein [Candidatus Diapherotrites archaeon]|nr:PIN domain-containing protein [Candidatus Diapherotrites archaeon]